MVKKYVFKREPYFKSPENYVWCKEDILIELISTDFKYVLSADDFDKLNKGRYYPQNRTIPLPAYRLYSTREEALQDLRDNCGNEN